jgi:hypothetical protein
MSFSAETSQPGPEVATTLRNALRNVVRLNTDSVYDLPIGNPDCSTLPPDVFLGGQLETDTNLFTNIAIIRTGAGEERVTTLIYGEDKYRITATREYQVETPQIDLDDEDMERLSEQIKDRNIVWSKGQTSAVIRGFRNEMFFILADVVTVDDVQL